MYIHRFIIIIRSANFSIIALKKFTKTGGKNNKEGQQTKKFNQSSDTGIKTVGRRKKALGITIHLKHKITVNFLKLTRVITFPKPGRVTRIN